MMRLSLVVSGCLAAVACARAPTEAPTAAPSASPAPTTVNRGTPTKTTPTASPDPADAVTALLDRVADPTEDPDGQERARLAAALRASTDPRAITALITVLEQPAPEQPVVVHRAAITALGALRAASAVDAILVALFSIPDAPTTTSVSERARAALASIGPPAVPPLVAMLEGKHAAVNERAEANGVPTEVVESVAATMLGVIDDPAATDALMRLLGRTSCASGDIRHAVAVEALGRLEHAPAVAPICGCLRRDHDPSSAPVAARALAMIGGDAATRCLIDVIRTAKYDDDIVESVEEQHALRWEAVRLAALAGGAAALPKIRAALAKGGVPSVVDHAAAFAPMLDTLRRCGADVACLDAVLADPQADAFAREAAAFTRARSGPRSPELALAISRAFATPNAEVRWMLATLVRRVAPAHGCPECARALLDVLERETMVAEMQAAVITARTAIEAVGDGARSAFP